MAVGNMTVVFGSRARIKLKKRLGKYHVEEEGTSHFSRLCAEGRKRKLRGEVEGG